MKERQAYLAKKKEQEAERKRIQEISMQNRKAKAEEKAQTSHANELKFGATLKKFEPPAEQRGR